jgi:hypothetical protein
VLDAGALIAHERRDPKVAALMEVAAEHRIEMILPMVSSTPTVGGRTMYAHATATPRITRP